ncbi:MAG: hypothetical protein ACRDKY_02050 [Solirubrobacteraceae bacterium]
MAVGDETALPTETVLPPATRNRPAGLLLLAAGAILLFVSLFVDWYEPGLTAWTTFEVWDMVLAALALAGVMAAAAALELWRPLPERWVLVASVVAPVIVIVSLVNHPPAAQGIDQGPMVGIWLALAGSLLMLMGALLALARISFAVDLADGAPRATPPGAPQEPPTSPTRRVVP